MGVNAMVAGYGALFLVLPGVCCAAIVSYDIICLPIPLFTLVVERSTISPFLPNHDMPVSQ